MNLQLDRLPRTQVEDIAVSDARGGDTSWTCNPRHPALGWYSEAYAAEVDLQRAIAALATGNTNNEE